VNAAAYPGDESLVPLYQRLLMHIGAAAAAEERQKIWVQGSEDVSFAVYDWETRAAPTNTVYLLNVNWWSDPPEKSEARLLWKDAQIPVHIARDRIHVITFCKDWGIWTEDLDTDVMEIQAEAERATISLQGQGETRLTLLHRPEGTRSASAKLSARLRGHALNIEPGSMPGLWLTQLTLTGPEDLEITAIQ
jgi:hypothetical protein